MPSHNGVGDADTPRTSRSRSPALNVTIQPTQPAALTSPGGAGLQPVVSNTTPLITLGEIGLLDVLGQLYGTVWISLTVHAEYQRGCAAHPQRPDLQGVPWVIAHPAPADPQVPAFLDAGERDAIALARAVNAARILLDERAARAVAQRLNLTVTGSAGVLLAAKQAGVISEVKSYLDQIVAQGRYLSPRLYEAVLRQAGE